MAPGRGSGSFTPAPNTRQRAETQQIVMNKLHSLHGLPGRHQNVQRSTATHTHTHTRMDANECGNILLHPHNSGDLRDEARRRVVMLERLITHSIQTSLLIHVFYTAIFSRPCEHSTPVVFLEDYCTLAWFQQSTHVRILILCACLCFLSSGIHTQSTSADRRPWLRVQRSSIVTKSCHLQPS